MVGGGERRLREGPAEPRRPRARSRPRPSPRRRARRRRARRRRTPRACVVPRWVQLVLLPLALIAAVGDRQSGRESAGDLHRRRADRADPQPRRRLPLPRAPAARPGGPCACTSAFFLIVAGIGFLLANPISNQVTSFSNDVPHITKEANKNLANLQRTLNKNGIHVHFIKQGKTALQTLGEKVTKGAGSIRLLQRRRAHRSRQRAVRPGADLRAVDLHAALRGEIGALVRRVMPAGRRHQGRRLPLAGAERGRRATSAGSCCSA